ncbi:MAG: lactate utilization protein [Clostridia bacterium]
MFCENYAQYVSLLEKRAYTVHTAQNGAQAKVIALDIIGNGSVGFGGSMTVANLNIYEELKARGGTAFKHMTSIGEPEWQPDRDALRADYYLCSTNAITMHGELVNIDGTGNRIAGMIFGPHRVILIIGKNKLAADIPAAIDRIKSIACPLNARRLGYNTPCAITGKCGNCSAPQRICRVTSIIEYPPKHIEQFHLILVDEELGY